MKFQNNFRLVFDYAWEAEDGMRKKKLYNTYNAFYLIFTNEHILKKFVNDKKKANFVIKLYSLKEYNKNEIG
jgi:hypothetical protein